MRHRAALPLVYAVLTAFAVDASHITDKMAVGLYESPDHEQPKRVLTSGTPLEILDRAGRLCKVQLGDGESGWLECRYITDEKPARSMLVEAQARASKLRDEVNALTRQLEASRQSAEALEHRLQTAERLLTQQASERGGPAKSAKALESMVAWNVHEEMPNTPPLKGGSGQWLAAVQGVAAGFTVAAVVFFWRCRKKYGGVRI